MWNSEFWLNLVLQLLFKKKKDKVGSTKWHCRCTVQKHWMYSDIYKRKKKSTNRKLKKKKKCSYYSYNAAQYCSYYSKLKKKKKDKVAQQNGTVDVQCKNTGCRVIYIKGKKSTNRRLKKKKSYCSYNAAWYCRYCSKKKKTKLAQQNGTVDVQRKNTECTVIYIKGKKKYKQKTEKEKKKKKVAIVATVPLATVANVQNFKKKNTKWLTKMKLQINSEKRCMNNAKILQKKQHKSMTRKRKKKMMNNTY